MAKLQTCDKHVVASINMLSDAGSIPATSITNLQNKFADSSFLYTFRPSGTYSEIQKYVHTPW